jgi:hypothetical protein
MISAFFYHAEVSDTFVSMFFFLSIHLCQIFFLDFLTLFYCFLCERYVFNIYMDTCFYLKFLQDLSISDQLKRDTFFYTIMKLYDLFFQKLDNIFYNIEKKNFCDENMWLM